MRSFLALLLVLSWLTLLPSASAEDWPSRNVTFVVTFVPGGSTDITARLLASKLSGEFGRPVIVDNRPGAGGSVGAGYVAKAQPNGYTLLMVVSSHAINAKLYKNLPFDLHKDLTPVVQITSQPMVLVVHKDFPAKTLVELVSYVREGKASINYGSTGVGTSNHLTGALFNSMAQGKMVHVPYKGGAPAVAAVVSGEVQVLVSTLPEVLPHLKAGNVRALGITTRGRSPFLSDVPPIDEALPGYDYGTWSGLMAPALTPPDVVAKMNAAVNKVLLDQEVQKTIAGLGSQIVGGTAASFGQMIGVELEKMARLVKVSGAVVD